MKNLFYTLITFLAGVFRDDAGVVYNGDNYAMQWVDKPSEKLPKGEVSGKLRAVLDRKTLVDAAGTAALNVGDTVKGPYVPASCLVVDAKLSTNKSLGATGKFDLGYLASDDDVADPNAFVSDCDGGGQAGFARMAAAQAGAGLYKRTTKKLQMVAICTEVMDDSVLDAVLTMEVNYLSE